MEDRYYDDVSIAANRKREQLMKEAEEHRLRRHIIAMKKNGKAEKSVIPENQSRPQFSPQTVRRSAPAH